MMTARATIAAVVPPLAAPGARVGLVVLLADAAEGTVSVPLALPSVRLIGHLLAMTRAAISLFTFSLKHASRSSKI